MFPDMYSCDKEQNMAKVIRDESITRFKGKSIAHGVLIVGLPITTIATLLHIQCKYLL